ncbi:MAG TPA: nucleoside-diphosphate kinase [Propionibacteriaceae bacterium]|nr:nucleoside-diphosphate kinase [Propionibacteriaceae bacterium]
MTHPAVPGAERTLVLIKPDAVSRGLTGRILTRYEEKGLRVVALEQRVIDRDLAARHYAEHVGRPYYPGLEDFIVSGPLVSLVLEGERAIAAVRSLNGATDGVEAIPGSIRGDFGTSKSLNLVHASDSPESAQREIGIWFPALAD